MAKMILNITGGCKMAKVVVFGDRCKSCGFCVEVCPKKVLAIGKSVNMQGYPYVVIEKPDACIGCTFCAQMCPEAAIEVYK